jgi:type I restriction-modification system DNA methylase subunit
MTNRNHNFQTPPDVADYMASLIDHRLKGYKIFEPTPGEGNLVAAIERKGFEVFTIDDFFLLDECHPYFAAVVMNPPFSAKYANMQNAPKSENLNGMRIGYYMLTECMKLTGEFSGQVIALMPVFTYTDSDKRIRHLLDYGLASITHLPRNTFPGSRVQTCILDLQKGFTGVTQFYYGIK